MPLLKVVPCPTINSFFLLLNCLFGFLSTARRLSVTLCYGSSSCIFLVLKLENNKSCFQLRYTRSRTLFRCIHCGLHVCKVIVSLSARKVKRRSQHGHRRRSARTPDTDTLQRRRKSLTEKTNSPFLGAWGREYLMARAVQLAVLIPYLK